jgi:glycerol uptake facilitator-like aquaporin
VTAITSARERDRIGIEQLGIQPGDKTELAEVDVRVGRISRPHAKALTTCCHIHSDGLWKKSLIRGDATVGQAGHAGRLVSRIRSRCGARGQQAPLWGMLGACGQPGARRGLPALPSAGGAIRFDLIRRLTAEALGTALLVATVVGSGAMAQSLTQDAALMLLANTIATGAILVVLITTLGPISGGHFNPAVSLVFAWRGELSKREAAGYAAAQLAGGVAGTLAAHLMFGLALFEASQRVRTGGPQWFSESVATFGLVLTILAGIRFERRAVPWLVGLYITAAYWFTASTSFANPAVAAARALTDTFSGIRPVDLPGFVAAQLAGAACGAALIGWLLREPAGSETPIAEESVP